MNIYHAFTMDYNKIHGLFRSHQKKMVKIFKTQKNQIKNTKTLTS